MAPEATYKVNVTCKNCGEDDTLDIAKGTPVKATPCPTCDCLDLKYRPPEKD